MKFFTAGKFPSPVEYRRVATDWQHRGYSCDWFIDPPGREGKYFVHECNELVTVVQGRLQLTIGAEPFVVKPGDEVFIPQGDSPHFSPGESD